MNSRTPDELTGLSLSALQAKLNSYPRVTADSFEPSRERHQGPSARATDETGTANETRAAHFNRRAFIQGGTAIMATLAVAAPLRNMMEREASGANISVTSPYGEPVPTADQATGLELLKLPPGFRYRSFGWVGDPMNDDATTPSVHDGMAVIAQFGPYALLSRNHEIAAGTPFASGDIQYSPGAGGGCTNLLFNTWTGQWVYAFASLAGTFRNCAGGPTPWGTWLSCEETDITSAGGAFKHGYVFQVGSFSSDAEPLRAMGRFRHEAVACDPRSGVIYLTEDDGDTSGLYRFVPNFPGVLAAGGTLQMAMVKGTPNVDFRRAAADGSVYELDWVTIDQPDPDLENGEPRTYFQGFSNGAARFRRLEGIWYGNGKFYIVSTSGGPNSSDSGVGEGIVFELTPPSPSWISAPTSGGTLQAIYTSPAAATLNNPDNISVSPGGALLLCEDAGGGGSGPDRLVGLTLEGQAFTFAVNNIDFRSTALGPFTREESGITFNGSHLQSEWAGATFDYSGQWLFVNIQSPGITFAITGPWQDGPLGQERRALPF